MIIHHISKNSIQNIFNYSKSFIHLDFYISKYCIDKIHNDNLKKKIRINLLLKIFIIFQIMQCINIITNIINIFINQ